MSEQKNEPVQPYIIEPKMKDLLIQYAESKQNIVEKLAKFHIGFEFINTFIHGNKRTERLIANLEPMKAGYPPFDMNCIVRMHYYNFFNDKK